jgi:hypothetical protein
MSLDGCERRGKATTGRRSSIGTSMPKSPSASPAVSARRQQTMVLPSPARGLVRHAPSVASEAHSDSSTAVQVHLSWFSAPETIARCLSVDQGLARLSQNRPGLALQVVYVPSRQRMTFVLLVPNSGPKPVPGSESQPSPYSFRRSESRYRCPTPPTLARVVRIGGFSRVHVFAPPCAQSTQRLWQPTAPPSDATAVGARVALATQAHATRAAAVGGATLGNDGARSPSPGRNRNTGAPARVVSSGYDNGPERRRGQGSNQPSGRARKGQRRPRQGTSASDGILR